MYALILNTKPRCTYKLVCCDVLVKRVMPTNKQHLMLFTQIRHGWRSLIALVCVKAPFFVGIWFPTFASRTFDAHDGLFACNANRHVAEQSCFHKVLAHVAG